VNADPSAALVIRVWLEGGTGEFRGRVTSVDTWTGAAGGGGVTVAVASSPREVTDAVSCLLEEFIRDASKRIDSE
jgi:hypothetical protein